MFFTLMLIAGGAGTLWSQTGDAERGETEGGSNGAGRRTRGEARGRAALSAPATEAVQLNLLGNANTAAGESRRNENIQFNLVDNNALKELNVRLGVSATILTEMQPARGYFGAEFGGTPSAPIHVTVPPVSAWHGQAYESISTVRSAR
ncbi:MAG: hypothetical protein U5J83_02855 [Bryobacterales bacterium]|nr:hypothetical protein [Bryobacterales bacterium]